MDAISEQDEAMPQPGQQPQFPMLLGEMTPQGLIIRLIRSPQDEQRILILTPQADQMCLAWLVHRPDEVYLELIRTRKRAKEQQAAIANVIKDPYRVKVGSRGN